MNGRKEMLAKKMERGVGENRFNMHMTESA
jgi:hypothetical protein